MKTKTLTEREREVVLLLAGGYTYPKAAEKLKISQHTVKFHVNEMFSRFDAKTAAMLIARLTVLGELSIVDLHLASAPPRDEVRRCGVDIDALGRGSRTCAEPAGHEGAHRRAGL
jgi:DNA-binding CsgD family transcriptional regulator